MEKRAQRVLVTGAAGHLGSHLIPELAREGFEVAGIDRAEPIAEIAGMERFARVDLADRQGIEEVLEGVELILHCASIHPWKEYADEQYLDANIKGTWNLYTAAAAAGVDRVVLTSSIAAVGYRAEPALWPVGEEYQGVPEDLYSLTKNAQETIARQFAARGLVRTIALRPPAFMPRDELETGFGLLGTFALVEDIASAHVAAARVLAGKVEPPEPLRAFEAFFCTLALPYTAAEVGENAGGSVDAELVGRHWPQAVGWLVERGFRGSWLPAVYDIAKAKRLLGWAPKYDFDWWFARQQG